MIAKLISLWVVGSFVTTIFLIICVYAGLPPMMESWPLSFLVALSPVGALQGWFLIWLLAFVTPGISPGSATRSVAGASSRWYGRTYDASGAYTGKVTAGGRRYDAAGQYEGRYAEDGRVFDASGGYEGKVTEGGRRYDASGQYAGKATEEGRVFDAAGEYQGKNIQE